MNKTEFLTALEQRLSVLPETERKRSLLYFEEIIADRMEEGMSEEEVIAQMESVDDIANGIINDAMENEPHTFPEENAKKIGGCPMWLAILLAVLASPIWLPIGIAVAAVALSLYVTVWALILSLYGIVIGFVVGGLVAAVAALFTLAVNPPYVVLLIEGMSLFLIGLGILLVFPAVIFTRWFAKATVWCVYKIAEKGGKRK